MRLTIAISFALVLVVPAQADVLTFENDYEGFVEAAGPLSVIDFETLPNGEPSYAGVEITEDFNYDAQGAHFSAPFPYPKIGGTFAFDLRTFEPLEDHTWLTADLTTPAYAVGAFFAGTTLLCAYDVNGEQLGCAFYSEPGGPNFVGIVSDVPIYSAIFDRGTTLASISDFEFSPVPEPSSLALLVSGVALVVRRRRQAAR